MMKIDGMNTHDGKKREREYRRENTAVGWCCDYLLRAEQKCQWCGEKIEVEKMPTLDANAKISTGQTRLQ